MAEAKRTRLEEAKRTRLELTEAKRTRLEEAKRTRLEEAKRTRLEQKAKKVAETAADTTENRQARDFDFNLDVERNAVSTLYLTNVHPKPRPHPIIS